MLLLSAVSKFNNTLGGMRASLDYWYRCMPQQYGVRYNTSRKFALAWQLGSLGFRCSFRRRWSSTHFSFQPATAASTGGGRVLNISWTYTSQLQQLPATGVHFVGGRLTWRCTHWLLKSPSACWQFRRHRWPVRGYFLRPVTSSNLDFDFFQFWEKILIFDFEYGNRPSLIHYHEHKVFCAFRLIKNHYSNYH